LEDYQALYEGCEEEWLGDASVWYLHSQTAVREIAAYSEDPRVIVMLRRPDDMIRSLIGQLYASGREDHPDINVAWAMSPKRRRGRDIPRNALEPRHLDYESVAAFGTQLERVFSHFQKERVKVVLFEEFVRETDQVVGDVMSFLGVPVEVPSELPVVNKAKIPAWPVLSRFLMYPPWPMSAIKATLKRVPVIKHRSLLRGVYDTLSIPARKQEWTPETRAHIAECYAGEIARLERLLDRSFDHWRT
jgi:hypothetical protein